MTPVRKPDGAIHACDLLTMPAIMITGHRVKARCPGRMAKGPVWTGKREEKCRRMTEANPASIPTQKTDTFVQLCLKSIRRYFVKRGGKTTLMTNAARGPATVPTTLAQIAMLSGHVGALE